MAKQPAGITIDALGAAVRVEIEDPLLAAWFASAYPRSGSAEPAVSLSLGADGAASRRNHTNAADDHELQVESRAAIAWLSGQLNLIASEALERTHVASHAAAVRRNNDMVMIAGHSGAGKSTLTAALVAAGWGYLTDEVVATDVETGAVTTYRRPVGLKRGSWDLLGGLGPPSGLEALFVDQLFVQPEELGGSAAPFGAIPRPSLVVFPNREDTGLVGPRSVTPARATQLLLQHSYKSNVTPDRRLDTVADLVTGARCIELDTSDLERAVRLVGALIQQEILA